MSPVKMVEMCYLRILLSRSILEVENESQLFEEMAVGRPHYLRLSQK